MKNIVEAVSLGGLVLSCLGCSFVSEQPPPAAPTHYAHGEKPCRPDNLWYPIADSVSAIAAATWVVWANRKIGEAENAANAAKVDDPYDAHNPDDASYKWARAAGYGAIGLFAASAIYGYVIEARCASYREAHSISPEISNAPGRNFPSSVFDYG